MHDTTTSHDFRARVSGVIRLTRPRQWIKNAFVLAPLFFTLEFFNPSSVYLALQAVVLCCLASSAVYIVNDLRDIEHDRRHPKKSRERPLASGVVSVPVALVLLVALYALLVCGWFVAPGVVAVLAIYLALNLAYSFILKYQPVVDIFTIAIGFVLRVYAGAVALDVPVSAWMFITTLCLALYMAAIKRRQELRHSGTGGRRVLKKYSVALIDRYAEMSATGALLFYSMYVLSEPEKQRLVVTIPLVLFGLFRFWYIVEVLDKGESPTDVVLADWPLLLAVLLWIAACAWALWPVSG
ncbi:MAG: decaprenyl-phosphate phosphoribosyltransferase [Candidatus Accumulibacter sp.]|jgi:4-hydroxybenzoate polyprenyltransferase|nr:decaprenyl-phosphate phosphoribosyltransferase [Accumulibacter sp.]